MRAGKLDRRILIQLVTYTKDANKDRIPVWSTHKSVWAMFIQSGGKEDDSDSNRSTVRTIKFRVRWDTTILNDMRIIFKSQYYKIEDIKELGREDGMEITTSLLTQT